MNNFSEDLVFELGKYLSTYDLIMLRCLCHEFKNQIDINKKLWLYKLITKHRQSANIFHDISKKKQMSYYEVYKYIRYNLHIFTKGFNFGEGIMNLEKKIVSPHKISNISFDTTSINFLVKNIPTVYGFSEPSKIYFVCDMNFSEFDFPENGYINNLPHNGTTVSHFIKSARIGSAIIKDNNLIPISLNFPGYDYPNRVFPDYFSNASIIHNYHKQFAIISNKTLFMSGRNDRGQFGLGNNSAYENFQQNPVLNNVTHVSCNELHTLVVANDKAYSFCTNCSKIIN